MPAGLGHREGLLFYMLQSEKVTLSRALKKGMSEYVVFGKNSTQGEQHLQMAVVGVGVARFRKGKETRGPGK